MQDEKLEGSRPFFKENLASIWEIKWYAKEPEDSGYEIGALKAPPLRPWNYLTLSSFLVHFLHTSRALNTTRYASQGTV